MERRARQEKTFLQFGGESISDKFKKSIFFPAIKFIANNRKSCGFQVCAYLMESARFGKASDKGKLPGSQHFVKTRQGLLGSASPRLAFLVHGGFRVSS